MRQPTANSQQPTANSQQPTANSQQPTANSQQPTADRWASVATTHTVLFVARTLQATARLYYDVMPLLQSDPRIQVLFTIDDSSQFGDFVPHFLDAHQVKIVSWDYATDPQRFDCDLVVAAHVNPNLAQLPPNLLVMSHGAGHHKYQSTHSGVLDAVSGLSPHQLVSDERVIPRTIALGGPEQYERLRRELPAAAQRAVITGDICLERLRYGANQRERYRQHLGVDSGQKLLFVSSTWGPYSLLYRHPELIEALVHQLPADEYRLVAALHPNCWDRHGHPNVTGWLDGARRSGLLLLPPHEGWRAALLACHGVIGDHGSVSFYAAALEKPLALASFGEAEVPSDSPLAALREAAPSFDATGDIPSQVADLLRSEADYSRITSRTFQEDPPADHALRDVLYRLLELDKSRHPPSEAFPAPDFDTVITTSHHVFISDDENPTVQRFAVSAADQDAKRPFAIRVLVVDAAEPDQRRRGAASVMVWTETPLRPARAQQWSAEMFAEYNGLRLAAAELSDGRYLINTRHDGIFLGTATPHRHLATSAAVLHVLAIDSDMPRFARYRTGDTEVRLELRPA